MPSHYGKEHRMLRERKLVPPKKGGGVGVAWGAMRGATLEVRRKARKQVSAILRAQARKHNEAKR